MSTGVHGAGSCSVGTGEQFQDKDYRDQPSSVLEGLLGRLRWILTHNVGKDCDSRDPKKTFIIFMLSSVHCWFWVFCSILFYFLLFSMLLWLLCLLLFLFRLWGFQIIFLISFMYCFFYFVFLLFCVFFYLFFGVLFHFIVYMKLQYFGHLM